MYYLKNNDEYIVINQHVTLFSYHDTHMNCLLEFLNDEEQNLLKQLLAYQKQSKKLIVPSKLVLKESQATEFTHELYQRVKQDLAEFQKIHELKLKCFRFLNNKLKNEPKALGHFKRISGINYRQDAEFYSWFKADTPYTKKVVEKFNGASLVDMANTREALNLNAFAIYIGDSECNTGFASAHNHSYVEGTTISNARLFESTALAQQYIEKKRIKNCSVVEVNLNILNIVQSFGKEPKGIDVIQSLIEKTLLEKNLLNEAENQKQEIEHLKSILSEHNLAHLMKQPKIETTIKKRKI